MASFNWPGESLTPSDGSITFASLSTALQEMLVPTATVYSFAGSTAPSGWLLTYGQEVSRTTYATLFGIIGTTYGVGDGSTTFNLPDLRGRISVGKDDMGGSAASRMTTGGSGVDGATLGASGGAQTHTLTSTQMPSHTHTQNSHTHAVDIRTTAAGVGAVAIPPGNSSGVGNTTFPSASTTATNQNTGGDGAHNNTQPSLILNYIIKT